MVMHQGSVLLPFLFVVVIDGVNELAGEGVTCELLYADGLVSMSETVEGLIHMFIKDGRRKDSPLKTKVTFRGDIKKMVCLKMKFTIS